MTEQTEPRVDVDALAGLLAAATPGPWAAVRGSTDGVWIEAPNTATIAEVDCDYSGNPTEDAALIAALVTTAPALLAEVAVLRAKVKAVEALADEWTDWRTWEGAAGMCLRAALADDTTTDRSTP